MFQITQTKKKFLFIFFMSLTCNQDKPIKKTKKKLLISYLKIGGGVLAISVPIYFLIHHFLFKKYTPLISLEIIQKEFIPDSLIVAPTFIHEHAIEKKQATSENTSNTTATEQDKIEINLTENTKISEIKSEIKNDLHVSEQPHITSENISNTTATEQGKIEINLTENTKISEIKNDLHVSEQPHITSENISNTTATEQGEEQSNNFKS